MWAVACGLQEGLGGGNGNAGVPEGRAWDKGEQKVVLKKTVTIEWKIPQELVIHENSYWHENWPKATKRSWADAIKYNLEWYDMFACLSHF